MLNRLLISLPVLLLSLHSFGQLQPAEGEVLPGRIIRLSAPKDNKAVNYKFEICEYIINANGIPEYINPIINTVGTNSAIITVPAFNTAYAWRVSFIKADNKPFSTTKYYHFKTSNATVVDTSTYRLKISKNTLKNDDILIIIDNSGVVYNLEGMPVWHIPPSLNNTGGDNILDLRVSPDNSFTAIIDYMGVEFDYNGKKIWETPTVDRIGGSFYAKFYTEFFKLNQHQYYIGGYEYPMISMPFKYKFKKNALTQGVLEQRGDAYFAKVRTDNILNFDKNKTYVSYYRTREHTSYDAFFTTATVKKDTVIVHYAMTGFCLDETTSNIYISYRNPGELVKIHLPSGNVLKRHIITDSSLSSSNPVYSPYNITRSKDGSIHVLCHVSTDTLIKKTAYKNIQTYLYSFEEPVAAGDFRMTNRVHLGTTLQQHEHTTGSVAIINNELILAAYSNNIYIVNNKNEIVWQAVYEHKTKQENRQPFIPYRVSTMQRTQLENMILK